MENIIFGQYIPGNSILHRLDPRTKLFCLLAFAPAVLLAGHWTGYILLTLAALCVVFLAGFSGRIILQSLRPFWFLLALTFLLQAFFAPGEAFWQAGVFRLTKEGVLLGGLLFWRLTLIIILSALLTLTTSPLALTAAVEKLLAPLARAGLPVRELAMMMTVAVSFLPLLLREALTIKKAQQARGADFNSGWPWVRLAKTIPLLVPLFAGAFTRAEELAAAMEARGYRAGARRTCWRPLRLTPRDLTAAGFALAVLLFAVLFRGG